MRSLPGRLHLLALLSLVTACSGKTDNPPAESKTFRIALLADTHIIDSFYVGPENSPLDTESILHSEERLGKARDTINKMNPAVEQILVAGDIIHDYGSKERAFYDQNRTVFDIAGELFRSFKAPVHLTLGNHDYDPTYVPRTFTEELFKAKMGMPAPYYAVDYKGWRFLMLNCFQGETWNPENPNYEKDSDYGSFGRAQLEWLDQQLSEGKPSILVFHIPLPFIQKNEFPDNDLFTVISKHTDSIKQVVAGHWHLWFDLGDSSGAPHMVVASTRYDEDSFAIVELTTDTHEFHWVGQELWKMQDHYTDPWKF